MDNISNQEQSLIDMFESELLPQIVNSNDAFENLILELIKIGHGDNNYLICIKEQIELCNNMINDNIKSSKNYINVLSISGDIEKMIGNIDCYGKIKT